MKFGTVEAIQVELEGQGWFLWPGIPERPPEMIFDEEFFYMEPRQFNQPNLKGPTFRYERNDFRKMWVLKNERQESKSDSQEVRS